MTENTSTLICAQSTSSNCTEIILLYILTLQRRESSSITIKSTNSKKCPAYASPAPWKYPLHLLLLLLTLLPPKLCIAGPAPYQWESLCSRVNQQHPHVNCWIQTRQSKSSTPAQSFCRRIFRHQVKGNPLNHFCFGMGFLHTTLPVQRVGRLHVEAQKRSNVNKSAE